MVERRSPKPKVAGSMPVSLVALAYCQDEHCPIAQLAEQAVVTREVAGSIPARTVVNRDRR